MVLLSLMEDPTTTLTSKAVNLSKTHESVGILGVKGISLRALQLLEQETATHGIMFIQ